MTSLFSPPPPTDNCDFSSLGNSLHNSVPELNTYSFGGGGGGGGGGMGKGLDLGQGLEEGGGGREGKRREERF